MAEKIVGVATGTFFAVLIIGLLGLALWGWPKYNVYRLELRGQAQLRKAEAKKESAKALAEAEIERAKGEAEANQIIGESLQGKEVYLRYLWIQGEAMRKSGISSE